MTMRTPEQLARYAFSGADSNSLTVAIAIRIATEAIEADRAQRPHIPTESEWHESERKRLGWTPEEWAENDLPEDWDNPRPVVVMWGDTHETPTDRLERFHEEVIAMAREGAENRAELLTLIDTLREKVAR